MSKKVKSFIQLDRQLIRVLGLNKAVVFCHLLGIQDAINGKSGTPSAIYQQLDRLVYDTGISRATIIKSIKYLEDIKLLHKIPHTEGNKTKYAIDKYNYNTLLEIMDKIENTKAKKDSNSARAFKRDVLNLYQEYYKNNTTSSDNFNTTNKDLKKKETKKNNNSNRQFLSNCIHQPITINYSENDVFKESKTYQFIPLFFKDEYTDKDIYDTLNKSRGVNLLEHQVLEYFLQSYYKYYGKLHRQEKPPKIREILQTIHNVLYDYLDKLGYDADTYNLDSIMYEVIDEYFNTPNKYDRDLTIYLLLSNDNGFYGWINNIMKRLY